MRDTVYARDLPPIPEDEWVSRPEKMSQTFLSKFADCPRSAYLYRKYRSAAPTHPMIRGSFGHEVWEELTNFLIINDEPVVPPELARDVLHDVLARHPEWVLPPAEVDAVRMMTYHWAEHFRVHPETVWGVEQMWNLELPDGTVIRGKIDLLRMAPGMAKVLDYKTSRAMMSQAKWDEAFQPMFYDVVVAYGETDDGQRMDPSVDMFEASVAYPRYVFDGQLGSRESYKDRRDLQDDLHYLIDLVAKVHHAFDTGKFPAHHGDHCDECPASLECPLKSMLRDGAGDILTHEDAREAAESRDIHQSESRRLSSRLRKWVSDYGPVEYGKDKEFTIVEDRKREVNWETLTPAIQQSIELGEPFNESEHVKRSNGTKVVSRKRKDDTDV